MGYLVVRRWSVLRGWGRGISDEGGLGAGGKVYRKGHDSQPKRGNTRGDTLGKMKHKKKRGMHGREEEGDLLCA